MTKAPPSQGSQGWAGCPCVPAQSAVPVKSTVAVATSQRKATAASPTPAPTTTAMTISRPVPVSNGSKAARICRRQRFASVLRLRVGWAIGARSCVDLACVIAIVAIAQ